MNDYVFRRREQKYLLDGLQRKAIEDAMHAHLEPDKYARSAVRNIYYDTPDRRLIRRSLEKPAYKEKLRLRGYGVIRPEDEVFLEMKKKYKGVVYKRRVSLEEQQATAYMANPAARLDAGQIGCEIDYFKDFYGTLQPALYLSYDRQAWHSADNGLRVTLDWNICYRTQNLTLVSEPVGEQLLEPGQSLLEIKTATAMPLWLASLLSEYKIRQTSFSKYGTAHMRLLEEEKTESRGLQHV